MGNVLTKCHLLVQVQEWWPQGLMSTTLSLNMELPTSLGRHFARELTHLLISLILIIVNLLKRLHLNGWNVCQHLEHCTMVFEITLAPLQIRCWLFQNSVVQTAQTSSCRGKEWQFINCCHSSCLLRVFVLSWQHHNQYKIEKWNFVVREIQIVKLIQICLRHQTC